MSIMANVIMDTKNATVRSGNSTAATDSRITPIPNRQATFAECAVQLSKSALPIQKVIE
jgi:hypothetical protein